MFSMLSSVASLAPTLSPVLIRLTSLCKKKVWGAPWTLIYQHTFFLELLYWNVILPRFQWFLLRSWWWYQGPGRKRSSLDPAQCSVQAQSHHRGRWLQHEQQLVPEVRQHFRIRFLLMWFELLRNHSQFYICLKPYVPDCQRMLTDRYSEETECCLQGERQYSTAPAAL